MDFSNSLSISTKTEPETLEGDDSEMPDMEIDIILQDVKKECLEYSESVNRMTELILREAIRKSYPAIHKEETIQKRISERLFCSKCQYSSIRKQDMKRHMLTHSGLKPFTCSKCSCSYYQQSPLNRHMLIHSEDKSFTCSACYYSCSQKSDLKRHWLTHSGEKRFICTECNYSCSLKSSLKSHRLTHSGETPFSCSECSYSCSQKSSLKRHWFTHSGEKFSLVPNAITFVLKNQV